MTEPWQFIVAGVGGAAGGAFMRALLDWLARRSARRRSE